MFTYLNATQAKSIHELAASTSSRASAVVDELGPTLRKAAAFGLREAAKASAIPGHATISYASPVIGEFIAIALDMRDSTKHLRQARSGYYSLVERVYLETAVLLPVCARAMSLKGASITEYTGDGFLALINVPPSGDDLFKQAYRCARSAIEVVEQIVNPIMTDQFALEPLGVGVGMSVSRAIVSAVGDPEGLLQDNAFGECVFLASKLSKWGWNEVVCDSRFHERFPKSSGGPLKFRRERKLDLDGFYIFRKASTD